MPFKTVLRALQKSDTKFFLALFLGVLTTGILIRTAVAVAFQSRAWIDEIWVVANPAYKLFTGYGDLKGDWSFEMRSWIPPALLAVWLRILSLFGLSNGLLVLPLVRATMTLLTAASCIVFALSLKSILKLKHLPVLTVGLMLLVPEFVHMGGTLDLSVVALPALFLGLAFALSPGHTLIQRRIGYALLTLAAMIRFQFGVFPAALVLWMTVRTFQKEDHKREIFELLSIGIAGVLLDFIFNSWMYEKPVLPILQYVYQNTAAGMASSFGVAPFWLAFEFLWKFVTEPVFILILVTLPLAFRRLPFLTAASVLFFLIHALIGHKEYRFFYGPALLLTALAGAVFQKWLEENLRSKKRIATMCLHGFLTAFALVSFWRASSKIDWHAYEIPSYLETVAGARSDLRGLIMYGWGGIYAGGNYTLFRAQPYVSAEKKEQLSKMRLDFRNYNYVVSPMSESAPCAQTVARRNGGVLSKCTTEEIKVLLSGPSS